MHLLLLAPLAGAGSSILEKAFRPDSEATLDGARPYEDRDFEYPPLALPLLLGPATVADDADGFATAFAWEMITADLAIVLLLALCLRAGRERVWAALGVYTAAIALLTGIGPLPDSALEDAPLPLARFDLVPAALVLGAVLARERSRSVLWSALLSAGAVIKAFPAALYPVLARGERRWRAAALGALAPLAGAIALVLALGDDFSSAITYHSGRDLQVESVAASPILLAHLLGAGAATEFGAGSWNLLADGAGPARLVSLVLAAGCYVLVIRQAWVRRVPPLEAATAALAALVVLAPLLSPQFLLWLLPLSAAAYGLRAPNLVLLAAVALTAYVLNYYGGVEELSDRFVLAICARNLLLIVYLALILLPLLDRDPARWRRPSAEAV